MKKIVLVLSMICLVSLMTPEAKAQGIGVLKTTLTGTKTIDTSTAVADTMRFVWSAANMKNGTFYVQCRRKSGSPIITGLLRVSGSGSYWDVRQAGFQVSGDTVNLKPVANGVKEKSITITQNNHAYYQLLLLNHTADTAICNVRVLTRRD